ncbi:CsbD family protein [Aeromicrobium sp. CF4.19]|uniref:CsbD family protein n=1 Tax=Aeromicrobium sp. CF4.19 TaxID=3373082 RepID=UPI003EE81349
MGLDDKIKNSVDKVTGSAKEKTGDARGDDELKAEGKKDQSKADLKNAGENVKDAFKN